MLISYTYSWLANYVTIYMWYNSAVRIRNVSLRVTHFAIPQSAIFQGLQIRGFSGFWGLLQNICFTKNQQKFYHDTDCRLKRRYQCRFMKMASSNFSFAKFVVLEKRCSTVIGSLLNLSLLCQHNIENYRLQS